jgi:DNA repair ATPase RecN
MDDVEIDDDIQLTPDKFVRSNSKQRRSSTRLSEKSISDKSISSGIEETVTSNSDLVGVDGLGKELLFTSGHDDQTKHFEHTDDDEDDDDDNDKKQLNAFDAWGYRREPIENNDVSIDEDDKALTKNPFRVSSSKKSANQPSDILSGSETSDTEASTSTEDNATSETSDVDEFQEEVIRTLERAYTQKPKIENIIVELNMLKPTYDVSPTEFDQSITRAVFLLPFEKKISNPEKTNYWNILKLTMDQITQFILKNYMKKTNEQAQMTLLNELDLICLKHIQPIGERILNILDYLYDRNVIDEQWILKWYKNKQQQIGNNELVIKPEEKIYYDKLKEFVEWLQNAESDDDDDDED